MNMSGTRAISTSSELRRLRLRRAIEFLDAYETHTLSEACEIASLTPRELDQWRRRYRDFDLRIKEIKKRKADLSEAALLRLVSLDLDTIIKTPQLAPSQVKAAEALGRLYNREEWGEKVEVNVKQDVNITVNHVLSLQEQSRQRMLEDMANSRVVPAQVVEKG